MLKARQDAQLTMSGMEFKFGDYLFDGKKLCRQGRELNLTPMEKRLLLLLAENNAGEEPLETTSIIAAFKSRWNGSPSKQSIREHLSNLRDKLGKLPDGSPYLPQRAYYLDCQVELLPATEVVKPPPASLADGADPHNPPYVGPQPFSAASASYFFGRDKERGDLIKLLTKPGDKRVVLLYAPSGAGKTSLIEAALRPALTGQGCHVLPTARAGIPPSYDAAGGNPYTLAALASIGQRATTWTAFLAALPQTAARAVLILDQVEEIITTNYGAANDWQQKRQFFIELKDALSQQPNLSLLLAFREEHLAAIRDRLAVELRALQTEYLLDLLSRQQATEAIANPASLQGVEFPADITSQLVNELSRRTYLSGEQAHRAGQVVTEIGEYVPPLHLQVICRELWGRLSNGQTVISWADFRPTAGGSDTQIIGAFVARVLRDFCSEAMRQAAEAASLPAALIALGCEQFVTSQGTRNPVRQDAEWTGYLPNAAAAELARRLALQLEKRQDGARWYELSHDTLCRHVRAAAGRVTNEELREIFARAMQELAVLEAATKANLTAGRLAEECCLALVAKNGAPQRLEVTAGEDGHLPAWAVDALAAAHLLRPDENGYVWSHPRLAEALHESRFPDPDRLRRIRKLRETLATLQDYAPLTWTRQADNIKGLLAIIKETAEVAWLLEPEAELVFSACLTAGYETPYFTQTLAPTFAPVMSRRLAAALVSGQAVERLHGAVAARYLAAAGLDDRLLELALADPDDAVRHAAAVTLAGYQQTWEELFQHLNDPRQNAAARRVLVRMYDALAPNLSRQFADRCQRLPRRQRWSLWAELAGARWQDNLGSIGAVLRVVLWTTMLTLIPVRLVLGLLGLNFLQDPQVPGAGFFQGLVGAFTWGGSLGGSLLAWWAASEGGPARWPGRRAVAASCVAALGGLAGGVVNTCLIIFVFDPGSLASLHWIPSPQSSLMESVTTTGLAFAMPLYGLLAGVGVGWTASRIPPARTRDAARRIFLQVLRHSARLALTMLVALALLYLFLQQMPSSQVAFRQLAGDAFSLWAVGVGLLTGLFFGLFRLAQPQPIQSRAP